MEQHQTRVDAFFLRPEEQAVDLMFLRHAGFEIGIDHLIGVRGDGHAAWKTGRPGTDLL
jgi:hypothetical protein